MSLFQKLAILCVVAAAALWLAAQRGFGGQFGQGYTLTTGNEKAEFSWSRLRYDSRADATGGYGNLGGGFGFRGGGGGRGGGGYWSTDYPKADRQFLMALSRLTRINTRKTEQPVDINSDDLYNYPWIYAVQVQSWTFTPDQAKRLHDYLYRGGFLMVDDFHGTEDWDNFLSAMRMVIPDRPIEDLSDNDEIFHVLYDLSDRFQVPGDQYVRTGRLYEKDGYVPKWRAIRDDHGRIIVAICHNMHLGDAWEWADSPQYPERFASLAFRVGINYVVYGMTH